MVLNACFVPVTPRGRLGESAYVRLLANLYSSFPAAFRRNRIRAAVLWRARDVTLIPRVDGAYIAMTDEKGSA